MRSPLQFTFTYYHFTMIEHLMFVIIWMKVTWREKSLPDDELFSKYSDFPYHSRETRPLDIQNMIAIEIFITWHIIHTPYAKSFSCAKITPCRWIWHCSDLSNCINNLSENFNVSALCHRLTTIFLTTWILQFTKKRIIIHPILVKLFSKTKKFLTENEDNSSQKWKISNHGQINIHQGNERIR